MRVCLQLPLAAACPNQYTLLGTAQHRLCHIASCVCLRPPRITSKLRATSTAVNKQERKAEIEKYDEKADKIPQASPAEPFVYKSVKWQLRRAKGFRRVLYIMRLPRHANDWQDATNITAALRKLYNVMLFAAEKERRRAAIADSVKVDTDQGTTRDFLSNDKQPNLAKQRGVRVGQKGAPPEDHARKGGILAAFLDMTASKVPRMTDVDMIHVSQPLRSLAEVGLAEDVAPVLAAIQGEQQAREGAKQHPQDVQEEQGKG